MNGSEIFQHLSDRSQVSASKQVYMHQEWIELKEPYPMLPPVRQGEMVLIHLIEPLAETTKEERHGDVGLAMIVGDGRIDEPRRVAGTGEVVAAPQVAVHQRRGFIRHPIGQLAKQPFESLDV